MNLRNEIAYVRVRKEKPAPKKTAKAKLVYFAVLALGIAYLGYLGYMKFAFVEGVGQIVFQSIRIHAEDDIKIESFLVQEGDKVHIGDSLVIYRRMVPLGEVNTGEGLDGITRSLQMKEMERDKLNHEIEKSRAGWKRMQKLKSLGVLQPGELDRQDSQIRELEVRLKMVINEIAGWEKMLETLSKGGAGAQTAGNGYIASPIDGQVRDCFKENFEVATKGQPIMVLDETKDVRIRAYFELEDVNSLKKNTQAEIRFVDGTKSRGRINGYYPSTKPLPEEFQRKYEPVHRCIMVDVFPWDANEAAKWKKTFKMTAKIRIPR